MKSRVSAELTQAVEAARRQEPLSNFRLADVAAYAGPRLDVRKRTGVMFRHDEEFARGQSFIGRDWRLRTRSGPAWRYRSALRPASAGSADCRWGPRDARAHLNAVHWAL